MLSTSAPVNAHPRAAPVAHDGLASVQTVVHSALRCTQARPANRRRAQDMAWRWVGSKWPRLLAAVADTDAEHVHVALPAAELAVHNNPALNSWTLEVAHRERDGARTWRTRAHVAPHGAADELTVTTSCTALHEAPRVVAPPGVLGLWVERLPLEDGGYAVLSQAREVTDDEQLAAFFDHLLAPQRRLPVIALSHQPRSRSFGVDPQGLAEAVRGVAHVAWLTPATSAAVAHRFGAGLAPVAGAARVYAPGLQDGIDGVSNSPFQHPLWFDNRAPGTPRAAAPGAFRRLLCQRICALSVAGISTGMQ